MKEPKKKIYNKFNIEKNIRTSENGITLVALVISIIIMLILAGVSLSATIGENGILSQATQAKLEQEEAAKIEELGMILYEYNSAKFFEETDKFENYLFKLRQDGVIQEYVFKDKMKMIKFKNAFYKIDEIGGDFIPTQKISNDLATNIKGESYVVTQENANDAGNLEFMTGSDYTIAEKIETKGFNFVIPSANGDVKNAVSIYLMEDMIIDNVGYARSAIDLAPGAILNLYVYGNVEVHSEYGESARENNPGKGGYAGIHVPEGAILNLYGTGTIKAIGGNAGNGGTRTTGNEEKSSGAGGGGAGAGIGGHGGDGGQYQDGLGADGKNGENCGVITIHNSLTIYAYGGAGGSGGAGHKKSATAGGAGGYPAAGIGGGGAGGAGGTCCSGAGGYTGGTGDSQEVAMANGLAGEKGSHCAGDLLGGGGYFQGAYGVDIKGVDRQLTCFGGMYSQGHHKNLSDASGSGGTAGKGGAITVSSLAKVYAFNGNLYTDGTSYEDGLNQCPIYLQNGIKPAKYVYKSENKSMYNYFELILESAQGTATPSGYKNSMYETNANAIAKRYITKNSILSNVDMMKQGIGSGAGYYEVDNGTYTINGNLNE